MSLGFFAVSILWVLAYRWIDPPITYLQAKTYFSLAEGKQLHLSKENVNYFDSPLPIAVVAAEDQLFKSHHGFDWEAIKQAQEYNRTHERKRGASTISQQVAKNVFLWPERSWLRKGLEVYFTFLVELFWSKERILQVYLDEVEFGEGVFGAEAASRLYFNKSADKLSARESARLAAVLPNPKLFKADKPSAYLRKRTGNIERQMRLLGGMRYFEAPKESEKK
jgi:monofunctional biosynthetic peptidoglycan transglycosylase